MPGARNPRADPIADEVFRHALVSVAEEMGVILERTAYSPNIKERRDHSCAVFDPAGRLAAQAAHIPVHLGAFPLLMERLTPRFPWRRGDVVLCNDPYGGGTHLPDLCLISPVFGRSGRRLGFVANRAHHADVGGVYPGSMGPATDRFQEGVNIPPVLLYERGRRNEELLRLFLQNVRTPDERLGDLEAQLAANAAGSARLAELVERTGRTEFRARLTASYGRAHAAVRELLSRIPPGSYGAREVLDDDGQGSLDLPIQVAIQVDRSRIRVSFEGTAPQQRGSVNATLAVCRAAVYYVLICLLDPEVPVNHGTFMPVSVHAPEGSLVNAVSPAAVAAGNVETSQRLVDVLFGALAAALPDRIPAASQGTMNNLSLGGSGEDRAAWAYYETLGGGAGAGPGHPGASGIHVHMSNTRNTPVEALEYHYPIRVTRYSLREGSGGDGRYRGGEGVIREIELLAPTRATLLTERRRHAPPGLAGGGPGAAGQNRLLRDEEWTDLPGKASLELQPGDRLRVDTPGGGGYGPA